MICRLHALPRALCAVAICGALVLRVAVAADAAGDAHARHHAAQPEVGRSLATYVLPDVALVRSDGARVRFLQEIDDGPPVYLNFVYTTCSATCPVLSQTFEELQARLGADAHRVHFVSMSIDPEEDTPARLAEYARRFDAGAQWHFYTGSVEASVSVQRAFGAYRGDKMSHPPLAFFRRAPNQPWVRLDGFASADQLLAEYRGTAR